MTTSLQPMKVKLTLRMTATLKKSLIVSLLFPRMERHKAVFLVVSADRVESEDPQPSSSSQKRKRRAKSPPPPNSSSAPARKKRKQAHDKEYGVTRGVDFIDVSCVLNFDLPTSSRAYTHRVGRTARAGRTGMALSFVVPQDEW